MKLQRAECYSLPTVFSYFLHLHCSFEGQTHYLCAWPKGFIFMSSKHSTAWSLINGIGTWIGTSAMAYDMKIYVFGLRRNNSYAENTHPYCKIWWWIFAVMGFFAPTGTGALVKDNCIMNFTKCQCTF